MTDAALDEDRKSPFDVFSSARLRSPTLERLWRDAYGDAYPAPVRPNAFYPKSVLTRIIDTIGAASGQLLVDSGCGHGGVGLWMAQQLNMRLIGHDPSKGSIALARERAKREGFEGRSEFFVGELAGVPLESAACTAMISMDALLFVPDKAAFVNEAARIIRSGGLFAFTTWEQAGSSSRLTAPQLADHRPLLAAGGFDIKVYEEPPDWREQQNRLLTSIVSEEETVAGEIGDEGAHAFAQMARGALAEQSARRYVFVLARRR